MTRAQTSWLLGLIAGLLVGAVLWFGFSQMHATPAASNATATAAWGKTACIQAALASESCFSNGAFQRNASFTHGNQSYACHCGTPESEPSQNLTNPTPWPDENEAQPSLEPWPDVDRIQTTVVAGPNNANAPAQNRSDGAMRITNGPGSDQNPAFLNENTLVFTRFSEGYNKGPAALIGSYVENRTEFIIWQDEAQNVNTNGNPFTPDKKQVCYASDVEDTDEIWCLDLATKQRTRITHQGTSQLFEPSVSSDGKSIAFEMHRSGSESGSIAVTDFSGNIKPLVEDAADNRLPQFNPSDGRMLFQRRTGNPKDNTFQLAMRHPNATLETLPLSTAGGTDASWVGTDEIIYSSEDERFPKAKIFSFSVASKTGRQETFDSAAEDGAPAASPDGVWLAFESHATQDQNSPTRIWIMRRK